MDFETYIMRVVAAEMPASFEAEALKAQAVAARTYAMRKIKANSADPIHKGALICTDSTHCQAYNDMSKMEKGNRKKIRSAVRQTEGELILYQDEPISAVFHSAAHGQTENAADVWGGDVPYLKSVPSPGDYLCPDYVTTAVFSYDEIENILGLDVPPVIGKSALSAAGGVMEILIGGKAFKGTDVRAKLGLRSTCFTAEDDGANIVFTVTGYGHGVGMSQWGANGMAKGGADYKEILYHYYTGVKITEKDGF